jgi:hypothetical protein
MTKRTVGLIALLLMVGAVAPFARAQTPSVEDQLLILINGARFNKVVMHAGLRTSGRQHSAAMASSGSIGHASSRSRIYASNPDPAESNGPPDDGFTSTWCEVAGWEPAGAEEGTARRFFDDWIQSAQDNACMTNPATTAAGIGVYESSGRWWATLEMIQDRTPPRPPAVKPGATATPEVATSPAIFGDENGTPAPSNLADSDQTSTITRGIGWKELAVAAGGFSVVPILSTLRRRRKKAHAQ